MNLISIIRFLKSVANHPLNQQRKVEAIKNWLKWHIGSRLVPGLVVVPFVNGASLLVKTGLRGATENIYMGLTDFEDMAFLLHLLKPGDVFVDVGANVGAYTILASAVRGARSVTIEPIPQAFEYLRTNVNLNNINHLVDCHNIGIGSSAGTLKFTSNLDCINHVTSEGETNEDLLEVKVLPLDDVLQQVSPTLMKIDVEGFEMQVLSGAEATLKQESLLAVILELNGSGLRYGYSDEMLHQIMIDYGFSTFYYSPFERQLKPSNGKNQRARNTIYIKNLNRVHDRLTTADSFRVNGITL